MFRLTSLWRLPVLHSSKMLPCAVSAFRLPFWGILRLSTQTHDTQGKADSHEKYLLALSSFKLQKGDFCHSFSLLILHMCQAIVLLLLCTREMEPRLFYDSHNHHPWRLHRDIISNRLLQGTPHCQIKVSGWRSLGEQRGSVCRISTYKPQRSSVCMFCLSYICSITADHGRCSAAQPHTHSLTAETITVNLCRTTQSITTVGQTSGSACRMHVGSAQWEPQHSI